VSLPHNLFDFFAIQADAEAGTAEAGTLGETINKYEQEKSGVSATCTPPWVFVTHNYPRCTQASACGIPTCRAKCLSASVQRIAKEA